jgi:hypothetical protein
MLCLVADVARACLRSLASLPADDVAFLPAPAAEAPPATARDVMSS